MNRGSTPACDIAATSAGVAGPGATGRPSWVAMSVRFRASISSRLAPTATLLVEYAAADGGGDAERQPLAASIDMTMAHTQLARFIVENTFINAADYQPRIEAHVIYRTRPAGSINRGFAMALHDFWGI